MDPQKKNMSCWLLWVKPFNWLLEFVSTKTPEFQETVVIATLPIEVWIAIAVLVDRDPATLRRFHCEVADDNRLEALRATIHSFKLSVEAEAGAEQM
jgi:hypothetical protein